MQKKKRNKKIIIVAVIIIAILLLLIFSKNIIKSQNKNKLNLSENTAQETGFSEPNVPVLSAGMIPIKLDGESWIITTQNDKNWYDYKNGKPAYIMLNDGYYRSELERGITEDQLASNNVGNDALVVPNVENNNPSIYMWIPRFCYNKENEIKYLKQGYSLAGEWTVPEMFTYKIADETKPDFSLSGIWVEIDIDTNYTSKITEMNQEESKYGFLANTIAVPNNQTNQNAIQKYVGEREFALTDITNSNRIILQIVNTNYVEAIKAKAYYSEPDGKIKIEVTYNTNSIVKILDEYENILSTDSNFADTGDTPIGNGTYKFIIIDDKNNMKEVSTTVSGLDIYIIKDEQTLKTFRTAVNTNRTTKNTKAYQVADVELNKGKYTKNEETGVITFDSTAEQWTPIGYYYSTTGYYSFRGAYYGGGHTISGLYINNSTKEYQGLFGNMQGTIQDLGLVDGLVNGKNYVGGLASNSSGTILNCYNSMNVGGSGYRVGGIAGESSSSSEISNCYNSGNITSTGNGCGGIAGNTSGAIYSCYNTGIIKGTGNTGGIVGNATNSSGNIYYSYNKGEVSGKSSVGGISGQYGNIRYCYNVANIIGTSSVGGIVGYGPYGINYSYNTGNITSTGTHCGGIAGNRGSAYIYSVYNTGDITGTSSSIGGIVGSASTVGSYLRINCAYNLGNSVTSTTNDCVGGIAGSPGGGIDKCYNIASVTGRGDVGGIAGENYNGASISNSYNLGVVNANGTYSSTNVGGIAGKNENASSKINNCINVGELKYAPYRGGILGTAYSNPSNEIIDCGYLKGTALYAEGKTRVNTNTTVYENLEDVPTILDIIGTDDFKMDENINKDYPVLKWQTTNDKLDLINKQNVFVEDTQGLNDGYPIFAWQVQ